MLHTITRGDGPETVVLVHGFLGTSRNLVSLARRLTEKRPDWRILLPDLRGHGGSPPLGPEDGLDRLAKDVCELVEQDGHAPVRLLGHSLGGRVALVALAQQPKLFSHVSLLDIAPGLLPSLSGPMQRVFERLMGAPAVLSSRQQMRDFFLEGGVDTGLADWVLTNVDVTGDGAVHWRFDRAALASLHWRETEDDRWEMLEQFGSRVHCIVGGKSPFVPPDVQERLRSHGAHVDVIENAGHFLHVDALNELVDCITAAP